MAIVLVFVMLCIVNAVEAARMDGFSSIDAAGDSVSVGVDADENQCTYVANPPFSWLTPPKGIVYEHSCNPNQTESVFNVVERVNCSRSAADPVIISMDNHAVSGSTMIGNFYNQTVAIKASFASLPQTEQRLVIVLMGHNDYCSGKITQKYWPFWPFTQSCSNLPNSADRDPELHCSAYPGSFEREFRRGLDQLVQIPNIKIAVISPGRLTQLCNLQTKLHKSGIACAAFWAAADLIGRDICIPLTGTTWTDIQCSDGRVSRAYTRLADYRASLFTAAQAYNAIQVGGLTPVFTYKGSSAGGAVKANGVVITNSDILWKSRTVSSMVSSCDCFHPSAKGQSLIANVAVNGFQCGSDPSTECCADDNDASQPLASGYCRLRDTHTFIPSL